MSRLQFVYTSEINFENGFFTINDKDLLNQLFRVLRCRVGYKFCFTDGVGNVFNVEIYQIEKNKCIVKLLDSNFYERDFEINMYVSFPKNNKDIAFLVEKASELGVSNIYPVISKYSEYKINIERLQTIAIEAMESTYRSWLPKVHNEIKINNIDCDNLYFFDIDANNFFDDSNVKSSKFDFLIGPPGGWSDKEKQIANIKNWKKVSFSNKYHFKTETACLMVLSKMI